MKTLTNVLAVAAFFAMLVWSSGCQKSGPTETEDTPSTGAQEKVTQANNILIPRIILIVNSGSTDPSLFDFSSAATLYNDALALDASNKDAHFGLAIIDVLSLFGNPQITGLLGKEEVALSPDVLRSFAGLSTSTAGVLTSYGERLASRFTGLFQQRISLMLGKGSTAATHQLPSYYQNIIETAILPKLTSSINHLTIVLQDPAYAFLITPTMTGGNTTETYRIDATEIYLFRGLLQFVVADGSAFVAYNIDYNPGDSAGVYQAWQPSSGFLAFRTGGSQRMKDALTNFVGAATSIQGSLTNLMNEPANPQTDIINYNPSDGPVFMEIISALDSLKKVLSGAYTLPDGLTINLNAFFNDAIPNYKQMVPPYTVTVQPGFQPGTYDAILTWTASTFDQWIFPDPTMRGLFPGMTDTNLKVLLDVSALNWESSVLIPGS
ncbi:MAG: hypothetical protein HY563_00010 [Ignavibacteriales bacterium]|nr:hypothetical protein [Ignavibacteriales bacterium]